MALNFEEYTALRRRQNTEAAKGEQEGKEAESATSTTDEVPPTPTLGAHNAGYFFETFEVQVLTLSLIIIDVAAAVTSMLMTCNGYPESAFARAALNMIEVRLNVHRIALFLTLPYNERPTNNKPHPSCVSVLHRLYSVFFSARIISTRIRFRAIFLLACWQHLGSACCSCMPAEGS